MPRPSGMLHTPARASRAVDAPLTCTPPMWTQPAVGVSRPLTTIRVVVLPAPLGPSRAKTRSRGHDEVDPAQHLDATVRRSDPAQLERRWRVVDPRSIHRPPIPPSSGIRDDADADVVVQYPVHRRPSARARSEQGEHEDDRRRLIAVLLVLLTTAAACGGRLSEDEISTELRADGVGAAPGASGGGRRAGSRRPATGQDRSRRLVQWPARRIIGLGRRRRGPGSADRIRRRYGRRVAPSGASGRWHRSDAAAPGGRQRWRHRRRGDPDRDRHRQRVDPVGAGARAVPRCPGGNPGGLRLPEQHSAGSSAAPSRSSRATTTSTPARTGRATRSSRTRSSPSRGRSRSATAPACRRCSRPACSTSDAPSNKVRQDMPTHMSPSPFQIGWTTTGCEYLKARFGADKIQKMAIFWGNADAARTNAAWQQQACEAVGFKFVYGREFQATETNFTTDAIRMKGDGVQGYLIVFDVTGIARFMKSMKQQGFAPADRLPVPGGLRLRPVQVRRRRRQRRHHRPEPVAVPRPGRGHGPRDRPVPAVDEEDRPHAEGRHLQLLRLAVGSADGRRDEEGRARRSPGPGCSR